jgi:hypothetical protein
MGCSAVSRRRDADEGHQGSVPASGGLVWSPGRRAGSRRRGGDLEGREEGLDLEDMRFAKGIRRIVPSLGPTRAFFFFRAFF